jgi:hypothetical protein
MNREPLDKLIAVVTDPTTDRDAWVEAINAMFAERECWRKENVPQVMGEIAAHLDHPDPERGGFMATLCGYMIEKGEDPAPLEQPLTRHLTALVNAAAPMGEIIQERLREREERELTEEEEDEDEYELAGQWRDELKPAMPAADDAVAAIEEFWRPAVALFSKSPQARLRARPLLEEGIGKLANIADGAHWLRMILGVLDREPVVIIEPDSHRGIIGRFSGVVDNFQLNVLIMDQFPKKLLQGARVSAEIAANARGEGDQEMEGQIRAAWNLHTYRSLGQDRQVTKEGHQHWIWNEGTPEDIPVFAGHRVVLLGPPSYVRTWGAGRVFAHISASLDIQKTLTRAEVDEWLGNIAAANN